MGAVCEFFILFFYLFLRITWYVPVLVRRSPLLVLLLASFVLEKLGQLVPLEILGKDHYDIHDVQPPCTDFGLRRGLSPLRSILKY